MSAAPPGAPVQERTIPVQLVTGPDGQPQVSVGGRLLTVTAEGVQLPRDLILPPDLQPAR